MRFSLAAKGRLLVTAALWAAVAVSGQQITRTQISDTVFNADGSRAVGSLRISWKAFTGADGATVAKNSVDLEIVDGIVSVALTPNLGAVPDGTYYNVEYRLHKGQRSDELWIVPDSDDPVSISDIRVLSVPTADMSVSLTQVNGLPAVLDAKANKEGTNTFTAPQILREETPGTDNPLLSFEKHDGSAKVNFKLPDLSSDVTYTLPPNAGSPYQALTTDGGGALFWSSGGSGDAGPGPAYEVLQQGGTSATQRTVANFTSGFVVSDNAGQLRTDITPNFGTAAGTITQGNDARLSNARTPLAHAATHAAAASDPVTPASIGALNRNNDFMVGASPTMPVLKLQGSTGQAAALQEWRDGSGALAALITAQGNGFFRELGVSATTGGTTVSQFFEVGGLKKFALSATDGVFDVLRYDNAGVFLDRPLRVFRSGNIETTVSMKVTDAGIGAGSLGLTGNYIELQGVSAPANPASGFGRLFLNSTTGEVSVKKSSGSIVSLEGGGGGGDFLGDFASPTELTLSSGSVTLPGSDAYSLDTESDSGSDAWTGAVCAAGTSFSIRAAHDARDIVIVSSSIPTPSAADITLDQDGDIAFLICQTANTPEIVLFKDESGAISVSGITGGAGGPTRINFIEDGTAIADPVTSGRVRFGIEETTELIQTRAAGGSAKTYVTESDSQTLTNKTLTTPTVPDFTNARHDHADAAGGGQIDLGDTTGDASDVPFAPAGTIEATNLQAAVEEVASEAGSGGSFTGGEQITEDSGTIHFRPSVLDSFWIHDEFIGRFPTGILGNLGWKSIGSTSSVNGVSSGHYGVAQMQTLTTINTVSLIVLHGGASEDAFLDLDTETWRADFIVKLDGGAANQEVRIGFLDGNGDTGSSPPANGIYFELDTAAHGNWQTITMEGAAEEAKDTGVAATANWVALSILGDGTNITFYIDGVLEGTHVIATDNVPAANVNAMIQQENLAAENKRMWIDAFSMWVEVSR